MAESDYQRGLRGGDCNVSISDYERWKDWKAGNDAYWREQEAEAEAKCAEAETEIMQFLTPAEKLARIDARMREQAARRREQEARELADLIQEVNAKKKREEEAPRKDEENFVASIGFGILGGVIGFFVGCIIAGIAFQIIVLASFIFGNSIADDDGKIFITIVAILGIGLGGFLGYELKRERAQ